MTFTKESAKAAAKLSASKLPQNAEERAALLEECFTAVLRGSLNLNAPHVSTDVDAVTHIDYWAVNLDRAHGGIILAVRRVQQHAATCSSGPRKYPNGIPFGIDTDRNCDCGVAPTISVNVQLLDFVRDRYRSGQIADPNGRLHYEKLMSATKQQL